MLNKFIDSHREETSSPVDLLSDREMQVFKLLGSGLSTRQVADQLHVSINYIQRGMPQCTCTVTTE